MIKCKVYVDGSFINNNIGFGAVILKDQKILKEIYGRVDSKYSEHRQVAGELYAVMNALDWCNKNNIKNITVYFDYRGIADWATGKWMAKKELTKNYVMFIKNLKNNITWVKVAAHSGDKWNDYVDSLAKKGANGDLAISGKQPQGNKKDLIVELKGIALKFTEYLLNNNINAVYSGIINDMFVRIEIYNEKARSGIFDLYNTAKKKLSPDLRAFKDQNVEKKILQLWENFK